MAFLYLLENSWQNYCWHNIEIINYLLYLAYLYIIKIMKRHTKFEAVLMFRVIAYIVVHSAYNVMMLFRDTAKIWQYKYIRREKS